METPKSLALSPLDHQTLDSLNAMPVHWVADEAALYNLIDEIDASEQVALDTEFIRRNTYEPILALVQVNTGRAIYLVDAPKLHLHDFWQALAELPQMIWYACGEDLGIFYACSDCPPLTNVIDVQISLAYLTGNTQTGYSRAVSEVLGVALAKSESQSDWLARPLSAEQEGYACDDVRYLLALCTAVHGALADKELLAYALEDSQNYAKELHATYHTPDERQYLNHLSPTFGRQQVAVLQALTAWREHLARSTNQPNSFIISKQALREIVETLPTNQKQLSYTSLNRSALRLYGTKIVDIIKDTKAAPVATYPAMPRFLDSDSEKQLKKALKSAIKDYSVATDIPAVLVFKNRWLDELITAAAVEDMTLIKSYALCGYRRRWVVECLLPLIQAVLKKAPMA